MNLSDKLYLNNYTVDTISHLEIVDQGVCAGCKSQVCTKICPASVYSERDGAIQIAYEGCLECGACRVACPAQNIRWRHPRGGFGVQYRLA